MEKIAEKKFKCEICEKTFSNKIYQNKHMTFVHGEVKKFTCNVCSRFSRSQTALNLHMVNYHKEGKCKENTNVIPVRNYSRRLEF